MSVLRFTFEHYCCKLAALCSNVSRKTGNMNHDSEESSCFCLTDLSFPKVDIVFMMSCGFVTGINLGSPASSQHVNIKCIPGVVSGPSYLPLWVIKSWEDVWVICGHFDKLECYHCCLLQFRGYIRPRKVDMTHEQEEKLSQTIVMCPNLSRGLSKKGWNGTWVKINSAWKLVNKSQNKAKKIALLTLTMAKPLWAGRYFHPENCCGPWDPRAVQSGEAETWCISVDDWKISLTARWIAGICRIPLCGTNQSFQIHLPLETNFRLPMIKHRYPNHFSLVSFISLVMCLKWTQDSVVCRRALDMMKLSLIPLSRVARHIGWWISHFRTSAAA